MDTPPAGGTGQDTASTGTIYCMPGNPTPLKRTAPFFLFTLLFSWAIWIPMAIAQVPVREYPWFLLMMAGGLSPSLVGLLFIARRRIYSRQSFVQAFLSFRRIGLHYLVGIFLFIAVPFAMGLGIDFFLFGNVPETGAMTAMVASPFAFLFAIGSFIYSGPLTEEFGWRGFATHELLPYLGLLRTSLIIGIIWSAWHYPLLFLNGQYEISDYWKYIPMHLVRHVALTVIMTDFYQRTGGSVLAVMLIHLLSNMLVALFAPVTFSATVAGTVVMVFLAVQLLLRGRAREPERRSR